MHDRLHPDELRDQHNNPDALDWSPISLLTKGDWLALLAFAAFLIALVWAAASYAVTAPDRPSTCSQYRGAEAAACVMEK